MFYLNEFMGLKRNYYPDTYLATSINDFLESKSGIPKPSRWKYLSHHAFTTLDGNVAIIFNNVDFGIDANRGLYTIKDLTGQTNLHPPDYPERLAHQSVRSGNLSIGSYYRILAFYSLRLDELEIATAQRFGPVQAENAPQENLVNLVSQFA